MVIRHLQGYNKYKKCWRWITATTSVVFVTETTTRAGEARAGEARVTATSARDSSSKYASLPSQEKELTLDDLRTYN